MDVEDTWPLLFRDYGGTKKEAEWMVLRADKTPLTNGKLTFSSSFLLNKW